MFSHKIPASTPGRGRVSTHALPKFLTRIFWEIKFGSHGPSKTIFLLGAGHTVSGTPFQEEWEEIGPDGLKVIIRKTDRGATVEDANLEAEKSYPARFDGKRHPARRGEVRGGRHLLKRPEHVKGWTPPVRAAP